MSREFHYRWAWHLSSTPESLWPFVSDTNRFNRDTGVPDVTRRTGDAGPSTSARQRLSLRRLGVPLEWEEEPFEWTRPHRFGVMRRYLTGPLISMRVLVEMPAAAGGGTDLVYEVWAKPRDWLGLVAIPMQIGLIGARRFEATLRQYDRAASSPRAHVSLPARVRFAPGGRERLAGLERAITPSGAPLDLVPRLISLMKEADELDLAEMRPYAMADAWGVPRREVLELCLRATRAGLLEFRWRLLCPLCRGAREAHTTLADVRSKAHCDSCHIDFTANFERSVELTFRPSPAVREVSVSEFCVGGPQLTPHIVLQQLLAAGSSRTVTIPLEAGRYRARTLALPGGQAMRSSDDGPAVAIVRAGTDGWTDDEVLVSTRVTLQLENTTPSEQLLIVERQVWTDQAATAAEVSALQLFRDLFAREALRPGEEFSVGSLAIVFTDLRSSTQMYREIGDAVAFGHVLEHFDVVKAAIAAEGGAVVKTIGDAVMAVFTRPVCALRALVDAQAKLAAPQDGSRALFLKVGIHYGPCIAVTLNDRLDYFGSTINIAARLEGQSSGTDVVISQAMRADPEVVQWLDAEAERVRVDSMDATLKGFDDRRFDLWRVVAASPRTV